MKNNKPDYNRIFSDILNEKFPEKRNELGKLIAKKQLSALDIIELNKKSLVSPTKKQMQKARKSAHTARQIFLKSWIIKKNTSSTIVNWQIIFPSAETQLPNGKKCLYHNIPIPLFSRNRGTRFADSKN